MFYCTASGISVTPVSFGHHQSSLYPSLHRSHNSACLCYLLLLQALLSCFFLQFLLLLPSGQVSPVSNKAIKPQPVVDQIFLTNEASWKTRLLSFCLLSYPVWKSIELSTGISSVCDTNQAHPDRHRVGWAKQSGRAILIGKNKHKYRSWCSEWEFSFPKLFSVEQFRLLKQMKQYFNK